MNIMSLLEPIDSGQIVVNGIDITKRKNQKKFLRDQVGFLFQNYGLIDNKTVRYNMGIVEKSKK